MEEKPRNAAQWPECPDAGMWSLQDRTWRRLCSNDQIPAPWPCRKNCDTCQERVNVLRKHAEMVQALADRAEDTETQYQRGLRYAARVKAEAVIAEERYEGTFHLKVGLGYMMQRLRDMNPWRVNQCLVDGDTQTGERHWLHQAEALAYLRGLKDGGLAWVPLCDNITADGGCAGHPKETIRLEA